MQLLSSLYLTAHPSSVFNNWSTAKQYFIKFYTEKKEFPIGRLPEIHQTYTQKYGVRIQNIYSSESNRRSASQ